LKARVSRRFSRLPNIAQTVTPLQVRRIIKD